MKARHWLLGLVVLGVTVFGLMVPNAAGFREGAAARIMFTHVPAAFLASLFLVMSAVFGVGFLRGKKLDTDIKVAASIEVGTILAVMTLLTGIFFSWIQWGAPWQNDPRQISFLMVVLFYLGLMALRGAFSDPIKRASVTAAYAIALLLPMLFLTFVFPRLPQVLAISFHPTNTIKDGLDDVSYRMGLLLNLAAMGWLVTEVYLYRLKVGRKVLEVFEKNGTVENFVVGGTADGVVRPVVVRRKDETP